MEYLLIMHLIFLGSQKGGAAIDTVKFETIEQCNAAKSAFMIDMKDDRAYGRIYRKAECVKL